METLFDLSQALSKNKAISSKLDVTYHYTDDVTIEPYHYNDNVTVGPYTIKAPKQPNRPFKVYYKLDDDDMGELMDDAFGRVFETSTPFYYDSLQTLYNDLLKMINQPLCKYFTKQANAVFSKHAFIIESYDVTLPVTLKAFKKREGELIDDVLEHMTVTELKKELGIAYKLSISCDNDDETDIEDPWFWIETNQADDEGIMTPAEVEQLITHVSDIVNDYYVQKEALLKQEKELLNGVASKIKQSKMKKLK